MQLKILTLSLFALSSQIQMNGNLLKLSSSNIEILESIYTGTWTGRTTNGNEFTITLREQKNFRMANSKSYDVIVGKHSYTDHKKSLKNELISEPQNKFTLIGLPEATSPKRLSMTFNDEINYKVVHVTLTIVDKNDQQLRWLVGEETETIITDSNQKLVKGVSVPTDIVLKKVK